MNDPVILHEPVRGRFVVRDTGSGHIMGGIFHFHPEFSIVEAALYALGIFAGTLSVIDKVLDCGLPPLAQGNGIEAALRTSCWRRTQKAGALTARFLKAFEESNGWVVYGPSNLPFVDQSFFSRGHAWFDVKDGKIWPIDAPFDGSGMAFSQMLRDQAVWPSIDGVPHVLPTIESQWRPVYTRQRELIAQLGGKEISQDDFRTRERNDAELFQIRSLSFDSTYAEYLVKLREVGALHPPEVMSAVEFAKRQALSSTILDDLLF